MVKEAWLKEDEGAVAVLEGANTGEFSDEDAVEEACSGDDGADPRLTFLERLSPKG